MTFDLMTFRRHGLPMFVPWLVAILIMGYSIAWADHPTAGAACGPERMLQLRTPPISGPDVLELQERLKTLGHGPEVLDGIFGPQTEKAVRDFQITHGLPANGVVGLETWLAMGPEFISPAGSQTEPPDGDMLIVVDTDKLQLTLYVDGQPFKTYPVAVGRPRQTTLSPIGEWRIVHKSRNWGGGFGTRWLGLNVPWGIYGIHGTNKPWSIGTRASAGCIRMFNHDVEELYDWVPSNTPVRIVGVEPDVTFNRTLRSGTSGRDVVLVQMRLQELGFDAEGADGRFGPNTQRAIEELQRLYGLPATGEVYDDVYYLLGLK